MNNQPPNEAPPSELERRKNEAEVAKAEADARTAEATARKTQVEADKEAAAALREQVSALVPDLSKIKESKLEAKDGTPMWGTFLSFEALPKIADEVASSVLEHGGDSFRSGRLLITLDPDLASGDAVYQDIMSGLHQLVQTSDSLLSEVEVDFEPVTAGLALAAALPGLLSMFSAQRTVTTGATAANDLAAAAAVTRALKKLAPQMAILLEDFRLVPKGAVYEAMADVADRRLKLVRKKIELADKKSKTDAALTEAKAAKKQDPHAIADLTQQSTDAATRLGVIDSLLGAIDTVLAGIRSTPAGSKRSLLATTALHEGFHENGGLTHILLVKAQAGQARETLDNRPLWFEDKFFAVADASITFALIRNSDSTVVDSGTVTRLASARGAIDHEPALTVSEGRT